MAGLEAMLSRSRALAETGDLAEARRLYEAIVAAAPDHADARIELGVVLARQGARNEARDHFEAALALQPGDAVVLVNLAELARAAGDFEAARAHYEACLQAAPSDIDALFGLGETLYRLHRPREALPLLGEALRQAPRDAEILNAFGMAAEALGKRRQAAEAYRRALAVSPDFEAALINLAMLLSSSGRPEEARTLLAQADARQPFSVQALLAFADCALNAGRDAQAEALCERAGRAGAERGELLTLRARMLERSGQFDAAREAYREAIARWPRAGYPYFRLAELSALPDEAQDTLRSILDDPSEDASSRAAAGFALHRLCERAGEFVAAFAALEHANSLQAAHPSFDRSSHSAFVDRCIEAFTAGSFPARTGAGDAGRPIFIIGMPRSGTTLVEQVLASYEEVQAGGERGDVQQIVNAIEDYPASVPSRSPSWRRDVAAGLRAAMIDTRTGKRFGTSKTPDNYLHCGLIATLLPDARIVYCRRQPGDVILSIFAQNFRAAIPYAHDLGDIAHVCREHLRLMRHWREALPMPIHTVDYEALVTNPASQAHALVDYCGLKWDDACVATHEVQRPIHTASVWQVRQPIYTASMGKWKNYERQLAAFVKEVEAV